MAQISRRFYANKATQRHKTVEVEFGKMYVDNISEQVKFSVSSEEGYMRVSMTTGEAYELSLQLHKMASICRDSALKA